MKINGVWHEGCIADRKTAEALICQDEENLQFVVDPLRQRLALEIREAFEWVSRCGGYLQYESAWLRGVRSVVLAAVAQDEGALKYAAPRMCEEIAVEIKYSVELVRQNALFIKELPLKDVLEVATAAMGENENILPCLSPSMQERIQLRIKSAIDHVSQDGLKLQFEPLWIRRNVYVVGIAYVQNVKALQYTDDGTQEKLQEVIRRAISTIRTLREEDLVLLESDSAPSSIHWRWLIGVKKVVLEAVKKNGAAIKFASKSLQRDPDVISAASFGLTPTALAHGLQNGYTELRRGRDPGL